jgi:hypothetical protein
MKAEPKAATVLWAAECRLPLSPRPAMLGRTRPLTAAPMRSAPAPALPAPRRALCRPPRPAPTARAAAAGVALSGASALPEVLPPLDGEREREERGGEADAAHGICRRRAAAAARRRERRIGRPRVA